jgi:CheY-like chemotaxis protein
VKKVLLIDDDPVVIAVYAALFEGGGYEVHTADDGEAGLAALYQHRPDAVLLDLSMPKLNGIQWLNKVRSDARFSHIPVVIFTAGAISWQLQAARNSDAVFVLPKTGTDPRKVVEALSNALVTGTWKI